MKIIKRILSKFNIYKRNMLFKDIIFFEIKKSPLLKEIYLKGENNFEPEMFKIIKSLKYEFFLDCGANIGLFSAFASKQNIETLAIEPLDENIAYMKKLKKINSLNFEIIEKAISDKKDKDKIFIPIKANEKYHAHSSLINSFIKQDTNYTNQQYKEKIIETFTLNEIFKDFNLNSKKNMLIKLDIEGKELVALESIENIIKSNENIDFIIEIMINDEDKYKIFNFMIEKGYKAYLLTNYGFVKEERPLTLPKYNIQNKIAKTCWKNHFFTKKNNNHIKEVSIKEFGYYI